MFSNYLKFTWRSLVKNKVLSAINILGLAIGISASLVIYLIVSYHFSYDKFETNGDRVYRVVSDFVFAGENHHSPGIVNPMGDAMKTELTGLEAVIPLHVPDQDMKVAAPVAGNPKGQVFRHGNDIAFAGEDFFRLLRYQWLVGSAAGSLRLPYQVVLSESGARRYFPTLAPAEAVGKELYFNDSIRMAVTGIVKDLPGNTDFTFNTFVSRASLETPALRPDGLTSWTNTDPATQLLVVLSPGTNPAGMAKQLAGLYKEHHAVKGPEDVVRGYTLEPLKDLHFNADYAAYSIPAASRPVLYGLLAVASFLLILACINFINLSTAYAAQRAKETGIRKTLGSSRSQLIAQFLGETFLVTLMATLLSIALVPLVLKAFAGYIPEGLHFSAALRPGVLLFLLLLLVVVSVASGLYPALVLSGYKPVLVLKNQAFASSGMTRHSWLRKTLTVSQFIIAQCFLIGVLLVSKQLSYTLNKDLGFRKDAIVYFQPDPNIPGGPARRAVLQDKLQRLPGIAGVSLSSQPPSSMRNQISILKYHNGKEELQTRVFIRFTDTNYLRLYNIRLLAGRNVTAGDTVRDLVINETYAHLLGFADAEQALGKELVWAGRKYPIAGVMSDFNLRSLHEPVTPTLLAAQVSQEVTLNIALPAHEPGGKGWTATMDQMRAVYGEVYPGSAFEYHWFDQDIAQYYDRERKMAGLLRWAAGLTIFISCLGLLGLVMYTTTQRTKEIGVRKVLGATVGQIVALISRDFLALVLVAFVVAAPVAWYGANRWMEDFAYRTEMSWWVFVLGGVMMVVLALLTLGWQTIRAATANPVDSLRAD